MAAVKTLCCYVVLTAVLLASLGCGVEQADQAPKKPEEQPVKEAIEEAPRGQPGEPGKQIQDAPKDSQLTP